ncbi:MAG TPA: glycosyltransferase family 39 protein [Candidatus Cybelea sp.]|jgi:Dolichyl-phosphate-mannose-protein mannosyltransferase|nr:glycosyltransferase family 39 protein [Candidatus Cybelea sp.]
MSETQVNEFGVRPLAAARPSERAFSATLILAGLAFAKLVLQFAGIRHYGFFRDELYYMACGEHLAWGYVDQPPLVALIAWLSRHLLGNSLVSIRLFPVLAGAAVVFLTGILVRELGGGRFAQFLAAATVLFAPAYLAFDSFYSMNAFEPLFWSVCAWIVVRIVRGSSPRWWLAFGAVAGIGLENKHTMAVFGFALLAGLLLSGERTVFYSRWLWIGGLIALVFFLPNLLWEARHGWPQIEVVRNAQLYKNVPISPLRFLGEQIIFLNPIALPVWTAGLAWCFWARAGKPFRFLGWAYLIVMAIFISLGGKSYYALPVYPILIAAGGVAIERLLEPTGLRFMRVALPVLLIIGGLIALPFGVPLLPVGTFVRYSELVPAASAVKTERDAVDAPLPQLYSDMFGWDTLATTVAQVYQGLPEADRADCGILGGNYGEAAAIDHYGPALGLPKALSGHNSYFYWGPRGYSGACMIIFGERSGDFIKLFGDVHLAATSTSPYAMPNEQSVAVYVCRKPIAPLGILWPRFKMII